MSRLLNNSAKISPKQNNYDQLYVLNPVRRSARALVCVCVRARVPGCTCACVSARARARVCVCVPARARTCEGCIEIISTSTVPVLHSKKDMKVQFLSVLMQLTSSIACVHLDQVGVTFLALLFTSTETIRTILDGEPRTATSTFTQLLTSDGVKIRVG